MNSLPRQIGDELTDKIKKNWFHDFIYFTSFLKFINNANNGFAEGIPSEENAVRHIISVESSENLL